MNIAIVTLQFSNLSGSELYVYELAREYLIQGHSVSIIAKYLQNKEKNFQNRIENLGGKIFQINSADSKFYLKTANIIHTNQPLPTLWTISTLDQLKLNTPIISTIHSEFPLHEKPVCNNKIIKYIAVRPSIKEILINNYNISSDKIEVVYNPIDFQRFNLKGTVSPDIPTIVFPGTIDPIRKDTILSLINLAHSNKNNIKLQIIGERGDSYLDNFKSDNVFIFPSTFDIENYIKQSSVVASILLGRTILEGWACGKPGLIFNINGKGQIQSTEYKLPVNLENYNSKIVAQNLLNIYKNLIGGEE